MCILSIRINQIKSLVSNNFQSFKHSQIQQNKQMQAELTGQQYEQVLKYMQATSEQDFQAASLILKQYNFNLNTAINARFNINQSNSNSTARSNRVHVPQQNDQEVIKKFIRCVQAQNEDWSLIGSTYNFVKSFSFGLIKLISQMLRKVLLNKVPEIVLRQFLRSSFYVLYKNEVKINFQDDKLTRILSNTRQISYKSCFLVISPNRKCDSIVNLLNKNEIVKKIEQDYYFIGFVEGNQQLKSINDQKPPQIVICRYNVYKEVTILKRFIGQEQIRKLDLAQLNRLVQQSRNHNKRDKNVLIKYRNFIRRQYNGPMYMEQEEEQVVNFVARQDTTHHIREQNQEYKRVEEKQLQRFQSMRREEQEKGKQMEMFEEKEEERKFRRMSIPDEPFEGDIIRFSFRCPDGSSISRNFPNDQKVELIYHWIQTNDQIELEDNKKREFELLYSYPPTPLKDMKDRFLKDVFESDQEKLLIREL